MSTQNYRKEFKELLENTIIPEVISEEKRNEKLQPLTKHIWEHIPSKLYRYRECSERNFDAFYGDKLYAVTSDLFNDPYDCLFRFDKESLFHSILSGLSKDVIYALREHFRSGGDFPEPLSTFYSKELLTTARNSIINASDEMIEAYGHQTDSIKESLINWMEKLTNEAVEVVKKLAFIACFSEVIHSVTMWSHYADSHKGFALEYDLRQFQVRCSKCEKLKQCERAFVGNMYPVIYGQHRYDATAFLGWYIGRSIGVPIGNPDTSAMVKCQLYKSSHWSYEKEWRLVINKMNDCQNKAPVCVCQIKPTAIYYGSRISSINKKILHSMAQEKGIKEFQMCIDNKSYNYSIRYKKNR